MPFARQLFHEGASFLLWKKIFKLLNTTDIPALKARIPSSNLEVLISTLCKVGMWWTWLTAQLLLVPFRYSFILREWSSVNPGLAYLLIREKLKVHFEWVFWLVSKHTWFLSKNIFPSPILQPSSHLYKNPGSHERPYSSLEVRYFLLRLHLYRVWPSPSCVDLPPHTTFYEG